MKRILRTFGISLALLVPVVAFAGEPNTCCTDGHCCPHCPFCNHAK